jgi:very-short-patch-repair endonuclease
MDRKKHQPSSASAVWALARRQHGVVTRSQLLMLGVSRNAIEHRIGIGRLHRVWRGVYAVGRPRLDQRGLWMAAVLSCGPETLLSHRSAAVLWGLLRPFRGVDVEVVVPYGKTRRRPGITVHRHRNGPLAGRVVDAIPVTDVVTTLVDLATCVSDALLVRALNQADRLDLIDAHDLESAIEALPQRPGRGRLRSLLDRQGGAFADSLLELRFLRIVRAAGLPDPESQVHVNGYRVDFYWPTLGLVVETDGPLDHRTPAQQGADRRRDQTHTASGMTPIRFTEAQVRHEQDRVRSTLVAVADRLRRLHAPDASRQ